MKWLDMILLRFGYIRKENMYHVERELKISRDRIKRIKNDLVESMNDDWYHEKELELHNQIKQNHILQEKLNQTDNR